MSCPLCDRVKLTQDGKYPYLIQEFPHSYLMLGEHQYYPGYSVLVSKKHYKEMTDIPSPEQEAIFKEMMKASKAIEAAFAPTKMNMCSLGNVVPHVHWHFFPRHQDDPNFKNPPWLQMHLFESAKVTPDQAQLNIEKIRKYL